MSASAPTRRRLDPDARRRQLIELGLRLLARQPSAEVPIDRIAEEAGISRGLLFHYFPTKRDFHVAVVTAAAELLVDVTDPGAAPPQERLRRSLEAYVDYVTENRELYVALVRGAAGADEELQRVFDRTRGRFAERALTILGRPDAGPLLRTAVRGWLALVEETTLDAPRTGAIDRAALVDLQERVLAGVLEAAG